MVLSKFEHVKIKGILGVIPKNCINIDDELEFYNNDLKLLERNKKILNLGTRHIVDDKTTSVDLCENAAVKLIENLNINKQEIESVIFVSVTHDYFYPASACLIHGKLGLSENCLCYDVSGLACSGYVHGLIQAHALIEAGVVKNCLLLCGDTASTFTDRRNRINNMLFGDAGTATFLEYTKEKNTSFFLNGTRGSGWDRLITPAGGKRLPIRKDIVNLEIKDKNENVWYMWNDSMKGMDIFKFTMEVGPASIKRLLEYAGKKIDDMDFFAIHQANGQIVNTVANHAGIPREKYSNETFNKYANCAAASVATVLLDKCKDKNTVFLCTFGVGLSYGSAIINLKNSKNYGLEIYKPIRENFSREKLIEYWQKFFKNEL